MLCNFIRIRPRIIKMNLMQHFSREVTKCFTNEIKSRHVGERITIIYMNMDEYK